MTDERFYFMPASNIDPGMVIPVEKNGLLFEDKVTKVSKEFYTVWVYDLDINLVHNYIASGVAVHNLFFILGAEPIFGIF